MRLLLCICVCVLVCVFAGRTVEVLLRNDEEQLLKEVLQESQEAEGTEITSTKQEAAVPQQSDTEAQHSDQMKAQKNASSTAPASDSKSEWVRRTQVGSGGKIGSSLKDADLYDEEDLKEISSRERVPNPKRSSNTYGDDLYSDKSTAPSVSGKAETQSSNGEGRIHTHAAKYKEEVEGKLSQDLKKEHLETTLRKQQEEEVRKQLALRASVPRGHARPVERILRRVAKDATLYELLGLSKNPESQSVKKAYRRWALALHPDKNPHPDSKVAFDYVQDAYDVISSPTTRTLYDRELRLRSERVRRSLLKNVKDYVENLRARMLLFVKRVRDGNVDLEIQEMKESFQELWDTVYGAVDEIWRQPTAQDKLEVATEVALENRWKLLFTAAAIALFVML